MQPHPHISESNTLRKLGAWLTFLLCSLTALAARGGESLIDLATKL